MNKRIQRLNFLAITIVIFLTIYVLKFVATRTIVNPVVDSIAVFLTSVGFYELLLEAMYGIVVRSGLALKLYWGRQFVDGLWYYTYFREGKDADPSKVYFGVWRFEQDLFTTKVFGIGLNESFHVRSRVRSITDMIDNSGVYEIFNVRTDNAAPDRDFYSRSSMSFDTNQKGLLNYPIKIRGKTIIYGGVLTGDVHVDVYTKCESAKTEDDAIALLKEHLKANYPQAMLATAEPRAAGAGSPLKST